MLYKLKMFFLEVWWAITNGQMAWRAHLYHLLLQRKYYRFRFWSDPVRYNTLLAENAESGRELVEHRNEWR